MTANLLFSTVQLSLAQVRLGGVSGESGLVRFSCGLWNDCENDRLSKQRGALRHPPRMLAGKVEGQSLTWRTSGRVSRRSLVEPPHKRRPDV